VNVRAHGFAKPALAIAATLACAALAAQGAISRLVIPPGTILPARLESTISSAKNKAGDVIRGRIMQNVPLPGGETIREGSKVTGQIVEVIPASSGAGARVSIQFDKLISTHQTLPIRTNLRAIAGFMQVEEAHVPTMGGGEGEVFEWLTTIQIGGDSVFGAGGPVAAHERPHEVVGKAVPGGVLVEVRAKEGTKCRGAFDGNDRPQAMWVFSSDACGVYGLDQIQIAHAGREEPVGVIVLASKTGKLNIPAGAGMLLRVIGSSLD
jgi:hypothetical protein